MIAELLLYHVQHGISGITIAAVTCGSNENSSLGWHSIVSRRYVVVIVSDNTKMGSQSVKCFLTGFFSQTGRLEQHKCRKFSLIRNGAISKKKTTTRINRILVCFVFIYFIFIVIQSKTKIIIFTCFFYWNWTWRFAKCWLLWDFYFGFDVYAHIQTLVHILTSIVHTSTYLAEIAFRKTQIKVGGYVKTHS